ncbi:5'-methylthioadenosine/adenosylhomocysteine nucleosidase [Mycobacterium crocinum]|uniref:adenosylhomocysteine nucleosidase n=1 Tax=Mycolicibacterium crocinum TaxID=388459 RepID=A0ABY3TP02_9MYCO|nr:5'-methylthioadenosine/adenosylhomocysteine nucleosidase [Mycolicibacterium crocinum]MCV7214861.1 5'-methylthioadenosine/adenosylhomocysteine nucleosidase [Mycolicibacterium crocinum]ULN41464.1 5'-methylthioadenosine/adenosylhomocysteine nucleosidase [Mycolicibacterium crocinum]
MPLGLICAIPGELGHLVTLLPDATGVRVGHTEFIAGTLDGCDVVLAGAGMGKVNSALVTTVLADRFGCSAIVFSGVAGGLDPELAVGDVVIADRVIQHDAGLIDDDGLLTYQAGHVPFINPTDRLGFAVDAELLARVTSRLDGFALPALSGSAGGGDRPAAIRFGTVLSGDQYVHSEFTRQRLHGEFGGLAVEMEGGAVAQVADAFGIPWLVIRALSDLAGRDSRFDFLAFVDEVAASSVAILRRLLPVL